MRLINIDGSFGEGGGQIIRTSLTMSAITGKSIKIKNIRINRLPRPFLQPQHLMAAKAVEKISQGQLIGADLGSTEFQFYPNVIQSGEYEFDVGTAGSAILVAQTVLPVLIMSGQKSTIRIVGGTHLPKSPSFDYFQNVFLKAIHRFGARIECQLLRSGYYPKGGGIIELTIFPSFLKGTTNWDYRELPRSIIRIANLPRHIAEREEKILNNQNIVDVEIIEEKTLSPGNVVTIWCGFNGSISLGKPGLLAENVANKCLSSFSFNSSVVDNYLADQLLVYAALAKGKTIYKTNILTNHLITNQYVIAHFINRLITLNDKTIQVT